MKNGSFLCLHPSEWTGEIVGTFVLVFFGCGSLAAAVLTGAQVGIFQVAIVWGIGVALAIQLTSALSGAHLNPAVTLALATERRIVWAKVPGYVVAQLAGAFFAAAVIHFLFAGALREFEAAKGVVRGAPGSEATAMIFADFFPSPAWKAMAGSAVVTHGRAFAVEAIGTTLLMLAILGLTDQRNRGRVPAQAAWAIGLTVMLLISVLGPLTMAGFNPARDLGPRLYTAVAGWSSWSFRANGWGWLTVYIAAPILGAQSGSLIHRWFLAPAYAVTSESPSHHTAA